MNDMFTNIAVTSQCINFITLKNCKVSVRLDGKLQIHYEAKFSGYCVPKIINIGFGFFEL